MKPAITLAAAVMHSLNIVLVSKKDSEVHHISIFLIPNDKNNVISSYRHQSETLFQ